MGKTEHVFRSDRLRQLQGKRSQQEFAEYLGINQSQLQKYLNGRVDPSAAILAKIALRMGVSVDYLLGLSDAANEQLTSLSSNELAFLEAAKQGLDVNALMSLVAFLKGSNK